MKPPARKKDYRKRLDQATITNIISRARQGESLSSIARAHDVTHAAVSYHVKKQHPLSKTNKSSEINVYDMPAAKPEAPQLKAIVRPMRKDLPADLREVMMDYVFNGMSISDLRRRLDETIEALTKLRSSMFPEEVPQDPRPTETVSTNLDDQ